MENNKLFLLWKNSSMRDFHVSLGVIAVAAHMVGRLSGNQKMFVLADLVVLFTIFHYFIHGYFHHQQKFLTDNQRVYSLPKKKIAKTGGMFLAGFMVVVSVGMAIVKEIYSGTLMEKLKAMVLYIMGVIFGTVLESDGLGKDDLLVQNNVDLIGSMNQIAAKSDSPWENVINTIQTVLIIVGVVFLIVLCVVAIVNTIRRMLGKTKDGIKGDKGRDVNDREEKLNNTFTKRESIFDFSPNAKARRIYRRSVNRQRRKGQTIPEWMTPAEIEAMVSMTGEEKYQELHNIYEKARYSESGCTEEDAQRAKALKV